MDAQTTEVLFGFFAELPDPRRHIVRHLFGDILAIAILAVMCRADDWSEIVLYANSWEPWLATSLSLPNGIPCEEHSELQKIGAAAAFDPHDAQWRQQVKDFLKGRRVDLAIDNIGGASFSELLDTLGNNGKVSVVGRLAGPVPEFNTASLFFRRLRIGGVAVGSYTHAESRAAWEAVLQLLDRSGARPLIDKVFPFDPFAAAFARLAEGPMGKVLIAVN